MPFLKRRNLLSFKTKYQSTHWLIVNLGNKINNLLPWPMFYWQKTETTKHGINNKNKVTIRLNTPTTTTTVIDDSAIKNKCFHLAIKQSLNSIRDSIHDSSSLGGTGGKGSPLHLYV